MSLINVNVGIHRDESTLTYFYGHLPIFRHDVDDRRSFRLITSKLYIIGIVVILEVGVLIWWLSSKTFSSWYWKI